MCSNCGGNQGRPHGIRIRGGSHEYTGRWRERPEDTETVVEMHERLQAEIKAEHAAREKKNTDMLLDAMGLKP
jgi:hypothetical protein